MNKIVTDYKSLYEVPSAVAQFYTEETRERIVGHTEPDEHGSCDPITESYIVVFLNKPNEVTYDYVESRCGRRLSDDIIRSTLVDAITWEDFAVNHDGYIQWLEDLERWKGEEPQGADYDDSDVFAGEHRAWFDRKPQRPVIDMANRRAVYFEEVEQVDLTLSVISGEPTITYDEETFVKHIKPTTSPKPKEEIAEINGKAAIVTRHETIYSNLPTVKGDIDVGQGKDGIYGISNIMSAISAYNTGMMGPVLEVNWIMSDNSVVTLTIEELNQISADFSLRKQQVFNAYGEWRAGDMQTPFKFVGVDHE